MTPTPGQLNYIRWQNRALRFYLGARVLYLRELYAPAAFCAQQALETLVKATILFHDPEWKPRSVRHDIGRALELLLRRVPGAAALHIPPYFYEDGRYQEVSRYPRAGDGLIVPDAFLPELDEAFATLLTLVPFHHNSGLVNLLSRGPRRELLHFSRHNRQARRIRHFLRSWLRPTAHSARGRHHR